MIVLQNKRLRRIALREDEPTWVRIPPGVPHGAINRGPAAAIVVNAVLRHRPSDWTRLPNPAGSHGIGGSLGSAPC